MAEEGLLDNGNDKLQTAFHHYTLSQVAILVLIALLLPFELWGYGEYYHHYRSMEIGKRRRTSTVVMFRLRTCLVLNGLFALLTEALSLANAMSVGISLEMCNALSKALCVAYTAGTCFAYLFLLQKVKLVSRFSQNWVFAWVLWTMERALVFIFPVDTIAYTVVTVGELVGEDHDGNKGRCRQMLPMWPFWTFSATNLVVSAALIYLYAAPLRNMASTGISTVQTELRRVLRRNLIVSTFAVGFTSFTLFTYGVLEAKSQATGRPEYGVIGLSALCWDAFVLMVSCRLTTFVWLPRRVCKCSSKRRRPSLSRHVVEDQQHQPPSALASAAATALQPRAENAHAPPVVANQG